MSALESQTSRETEHHWTDEITEAADDLDLTYKGIRLQATAVLAVAFLTFASLVGLAHFEAPLYAYLVAGGTGLVFGLLVRRKRWRKRRKYG